MIQMKPNRCSLCGKKEILMAFQLPDGRHFQSCMLCMSEVIVFFLNKTKDETVIAEFISKIER